MRPAIAPNLVRLDTSVAALDTAQLGSGAVSTSALTAGYKPLQALPDLGFYARAAFVSRSTDRGADGSAMSNPLVFALYTPEIAPKLRLPLFAGVALPVGSGGGGAPDPAARETVLSGIYARQAMDNALFVTNYLTSTAGAGVAWVDRGITVQAEATVLQLVRTRGEAVDADASRTNFTSGLNVGYRVLPAITVSAEAHYQRWLSTPAAVRADEAKAASERQGLRDQLTAGGGVRLNLPLNDRVILRPGFAYFRGLDAPMSRGVYQIAQLDLPIAF